MKEVFTDILVFLTGMAIGLLLSQVLGCVPAPCEQKYGYFLEESPHYELSDIRVTPGGVRYDDSGQNLSPEFIDRATDDVENCLERSVDRSSFFLKVPSDWTYSCDGTDQVLPFQTYDKTCKGKTATEACPCHFRALVQCPNIVIATPNLLLYKDALIRFITSSTNPWESEFATCATPTKE